jgi:hypothetical protein
VIRFCCGCTSKIELPLPTEGAEQYLKTFDSISFDEEGFLICKLHHMRRYGWRVPNHGRYGGMSDYDLERLTVWGEPVKPRPANFTASVQEDLRPHIYDRLLDPHAHEVLARAEANQQPNSRNGQPEIPEIRLGFPYSV